ncbi:hypothetical protein KUCAC02_007764, partial [Chaenocephalus aceratus]
HQQYRASLSSDVTPAAGSSSQSITSFLSEGQRRIYDPSHPRQKSISDAVVKDLIIKCCLPLSIVDNEDFRHFLHDPQYRPIARSTISFVTIPGQAEGEKQMISTGDTAAGPEQGDVPVSPPEAGNVLHSSKTPSSTNSRSVLAQLTAYLDLVDNQASDPCFKFWQQHTSQFPVL